MTTRSLQCYSAADYLPIEWFETRPPLTVVVGMFVGGRFALASDSKTLAKGIKFSVAKLKTIKPDIPLAWGFAGDLSIGEEFTKRFVECYESLSDNWDVCRKRALDILTALNGEKRRLMRRAHVKIAPDDTTRVLITGFVGGKPEILELTDTGEYAYHLDRAFAAIGSGEVHARIVLHTMHYLKWKPNVPEDLCWVATLLASQTDPDSGGELCRLVITKEGVRGVEQ